MTAFLNTGILWLHQATASTCAIHDRAVGSARPALIAHWRLAADGRLACVWEAEDIPLAAPPH